MRCTLPVFHAALAVLLRQSARRRVGIVLLAALSTGSTCTPCPTGTHATAAGSTSCLACDAGSYAEGVGNPTCTYCAAGKHYVPGGDQSSETAYCVACAPGRFSSQLGVSTCSHCAAGTYGSGASSQLTQQCALGQFQTAIGRASCVDALPAHTAMEQTLAAHRIAWRVRMVPSQLVRAPPPANCVLRVYSDWQIGRAAKTALRDSTRWKLDKRNVRAASPERMVQGTRRRPVTVSLASMDNTRTLSGRRHAQRARLAGSVVEA